MKTAKQFKRKYYAKDLTKSAKRAKVQRQKALILAIVSALLVATTLQSYHIIKLAQALPKSEDYTKVQRMEISNTGKVTHENSNLAYALAQAEENNIDPYKVYALLLCENRALNPDDNYINYHGEKKISIDRGLWMINDYWHPEVSNACAYNLECSTKEAIRIIKEKGFQEWTCGKNLGLN